MAVTADAIIILLRCGQLMNLILLNLNMISFYERRYVTEARHVLFWDKILLSTIKSFELQRYIIALYGFLTALDQKILTMNISNNYSYYSWCG